MAKLITLLVPLVLSGLTVLAPVGASRVEAAPTMTAHRAVVYGPYGTYRKAYEVACSLERCGYRTCIYCRGNCYYVRAY